MSEISLPEMVSPAQPPTTKRTPRKARTVYPMRVYATEDPRAYHCSSETEPETRYLVNLDRRTCQCPQFTLRLADLPEGHPDRACKHYRQVIGTPLGAVIPLDMDVAARDQSPAYLPDPFVDAADESDNPDAGLTVDDGYVISGGFPLCASCGKRRVGEVGSECYVCVAAELCL